MEPDGLEYAAPYDDCSRGSFVGTRVHPELVHVLPSSRVRVARPFRDTTKGAWQTSPSSFGWSRVVQRRVNLRGEDDVEERQDSRGGGLGGGALVDLWDLIGVYLHQTRPTNVFDVLTFEPTSLDKSRGLLRLENTL